MSMSAADWPTRRWTSASRCVLHRVARLAQRQGPTDEGGDEGDRRHADEHLEPPGPSLGVAPLLLGSRSAGVEELALLLVQRGVLAAGDVDRRHEPGPAVELGRVAVETDPLVGRARQVPERAQALPVLVQPAAQARPLPDERLVGDLHRVLAGRQQPGIRERREEAVEVGGIGGSRSQLGERHAPAGVLGALAELGEPDEHRPGEPLLLGIEVHVHRLRRPGDRPADAAALLVAGDGQLAVGPSLPGLEEGVRQQRQRPGLTGHVAEHQVGEARLEGQARDAGRAARSPPRSPPRPSA